jgi:hypothetical protein
MSEEDYINAENELFAETGDNENIDYYEEEVNDYSLPDPKEASKSYTAESDVDIDDDEENTMEIFSAKKLTKSKESESQKILVYTNIFKESAESEDIYKTRVYLANEILKKKILLTEQAELYARIITNKLWYNMTYNKEIEKNVEEILQAL